MIVLDSASLKIQAQWLEEVLKNNPKEWTMVTYYHPIYSRVKGRDSKEFREIFKRLFENYHVDLSVKGHDHTYRIFRQGYQVKLVDRCMSYRLVRPKYTR